MWNKIDHIGIAVKNLSLSSKLFETLLGEMCTKTQNVASEKVNVTFFQCGNSKIELLEGEQDSTIAKFIEKRGEGVHHLAFDVPDIVKEMERLKKKGIRLLSNSPKIGADNKLVCFIHPHSTNGVLIELCQKN